MEGRGVNVVQKQTSLHLSFVVWPVAEVWRDEVCGGEGDGEEPLCEDDGSPEGEPGAPQLQEDHEVHPLILRLLQQGVDPPLTPATHHTLLLVPVTKAEFFLNCTLCPEMGVTITKPVLTKIYRFSQLSSHSRGLWVMRDPYSVDTSGPFFQNVSSLFSSSFN